MALAVLLPVACRRTGEDRASGVARPTLRVGVGGAQGEAVAGRTGIPAQRAAGGCRSAVEQERLDPHVVVDIDAELEKMVEGGLITLEKAQVFRYR